MEWAVKLRAEKQFGRGISSLTCNVHANRHTFNSCAWWWSVTCETVSLYDLQTKLTAKFPSWKSSCQDNSIHVFTVANLCSRDPYMAFYVCTCQSVQPAVALCSVRNDGQFADDVIGSLSLGAVISSGLCWTWTIKNWSIKYHWNLLLI